MEQGSECFDDRKVELYLSRRYRSESPNVLLEKPIFLEMLGSVVEKRILDLGCGDALFGLELLKNGCHAYVGIEVSLPMVNAAHVTLEGTSGQVVHADIEAWDYPISRFDLVISRLALHYVADLERTFKNVYATLKKGGRFVFSIVHPVITSCDRSREAGGVRQDWIVDDYFMTGPRGVFFMGEYVKQYHRTVEDLYKALQKADFVIEDLRESRPRPEQFSSKELYERRRRIPLYLFLSATKK